MHSAQVSSYSGHACLGHGFGVPGLPGSTDHCLAEGKAPLASPLLNRGGESRAVHCKSFRPDHDEVMAITPWYRRSLMHRRQLIAAPFVAATLVIGLTLTGTSIATA